MTPFESLQFKSARVKVMPVAGFKLVVNDEGPDEFHPGDFLILLVTVGDVAKVAPGLPTAPLLPAFPECAPFDDDAAMKVALASSCR